MDVYGLTGGIGSGKSAVATLLEEYGVPVVSADELSRIVVSKGSDGLQDVVDLFGGEVLDEHGELDRRKMAAIVFQDPAKRRQLESILHPRIRERFEQVLDALEKAGHLVTVYEVPLLFEKNLQGEMKAVILVTADEATRVARVCARDDVTETEVRARIAAQMDEDQKRKRADYIIENNGSMDDLRREVEFMLSRFLRVGEIKRRGHPSETPSRVDTEVPLASTFGSNDNTQVAPVPPPVARPPRRGGTIPMAPLPADLVSQPAGTFAPPQPPDLPMPPAAPSGKVEAPKIEAPKVEAPKVEAPKIEAPKVQTQKVETPKVEPPRNQPPKVGPPKVDRHPPTKPATKKPAPPGPDETPQKTAPDVAAAPPPSGVNTTQPYPVVPPRPPSDGEGSSQS